MKISILTLIAFLTISTSMFSQAPPQGFNYQAVVYDWNGRTIKNRTVAFQFSILQNNSAGTSVYTETHQLQTNGDGLVSLVVGSGTVVSGDFTTISWGTDSYFLHIELDRRGGANFQVMGTSQLQSVPYALFSASSGSSLPGPEGPQGAMGDQGPKGETGDQGTIGDTGATGAQGIQGEKGDTGLTGADGPEGPQGFEGPIGARGPQGDKGTTGDTGSQGLEGEQGIQGLQGEQGLQGVQGEQGLQGLQGEQGLQGLQGDQGLQGVQGDQGLQGLQGDQGLQGGQGEQGLQGLQGGQGLQGIQGLQGLQGLQGDQGIQGEVGPAGGVAIAVFPLEISGDTVRISTTGVTSGNLISFDGTNWVAKDITTTSNGGVKNVNNMQPWLAVNYCIALQGIFPSRSMSSDPLLGSIGIFAGNFAPRGWAFCDGQLLAISSNSALFSILGTTYGGDGRTTFGLPDLRGRTAVGPRRGAGLTDRRLGAKGGTETESININHTHGIQP